MTPDNRSTTNDAENEGGDHGSRGSDSEDGGGARRNQTRRGLLQSLGLAGLVGVAGTAVGQSDSDGSAVQPRGVVGTASHPVERIYTQELTGGITDGAALTSLLGDGLEVTEGRLGPVVGQGLALEAGTIVPVLGPDLTVDEDGSLVTVARSVGDGVPVYLGRDESGLRFRSISGLGSVTVSQAGNRVTVHGTNSHVDVSNGGSQVVDDADDINFAGTLTASDDTDNTATVKSAWQDASGLLAPDSSYGGIDLSGLSSPTLDVTGGSLTVPTVASPSGSSLTLNTDAGSRTFRLGVPTGDGNGNTAGGNVLGGHPNNAVNNDAVGVVLGGGGNDGGNENVVSDNYTFLGGGENNTVSADHSVVSGGNGNTVKKHHAAILGGKSNTIDGFYGVIGGGLGNEINASAYSVIGGGKDNTANAARTTVAGGTNNTASGWRSTVGGGAGNTASGSTATVCGGAANTASAYESLVTGGHNNTASGKFATVCGGRKNTASANYSFAAGRGAISKSDGAFVWADSSTTKVRGLSDDEFVVQAGGGVKFYSKSDKSTGVELAAGSGSWSSLSARAAKSNVQTVEPGSVLEAVDSLDVATWRYDGEDEDVRHMGPMAEDFADAFGLGQSDHRITTVDADGVAFAAIKGLSERLDARDDRIDELEAALDAKDDRIDELAAETDDLREENDGLRDRVARLEDCVESVLGNADTDVREVGDAVS